MYPCLAQRVTNLEAQQANLSLRMTKFSIAEASIEARQAEVDNLFAALQISAQKASEREYTLCQKEEALKKYAQVLAHRDYTFGKHAHTCEVFLTESATSLNNLQICLDQRWIRVMQREAEIKRREKIAGNVTEREKAMRAEELVLRERERDVEGRGAAVKGRFFVEEGTAAQVELEN